jgi:ABC-type sugar transport system permease subunit
MWRKALLITLIWFFVTSLLNAVLGSGISAFLNSGLPDSLGLTNGEFVMIYSWTSRAVNAVFFFLLI